jgi:2-C-methyl-D-erythritol 4-phosphate cytidylyltransferase
MIRTLEAFKDLDFVREIVLVLHPKDLPQVERRWRKLLTALKVSVLVPGGKTRAESVALGVEASSPRSRLILVHDAARPLVSRAAVRAVAKAAALRGAAILGLPATDTVKRVSRNGKVLKTLNRNELWLAQTPQAFRRPLILEACRRYLIQGVPSAPTDDAALLEGRHPVWVVRGEGGNFKISTPQDLALARIIRNLS